TLGWPDDTPDLRAFYPTSVLVTGYDILFFWVARMMLFGLYANAGLGPERAIPFRQIALHGLVRDQFGKKMSKSRGNTVDPLDWIERFGADATRFTLARGANPGSDVAVSEDWAAGSRNFCNKLWNAARFALMNGAVADQGLPERLTTVDRWIVSRLASVTAEVDELFERFEFAKACEALYHFAWDEFCDWYLELAKTVLVKTALTGPDAAADADAAAATRRVLGVVLDRLLRLIHPILPFVTDELWTALTGRESVVVARWPGAVAAGAQAEAPLPADPAAEAEITALMRLVTEVRRFRSDQGLPPAQRVPAMLAGLAATPLAQHEAQIRALTRLTEPAGDSGEFTPTASVEAQDVTVQLDTAAGLDVGAERKRAEKDLAAARAEIESVGRKLGNPSFVERAPAEVVAKNRARLAAAEDEVRRLTERLAALPLPLRTGVDTG
ncbi:MAG: class I tRNA ligase family protein, partial [Streptosporangiaceae bacterium]